MFWKTHTHKRTQSHMHIYQYGISIFEGFDFKHQSNYSIWYKLEQTPEPGRSQWKTSIFVFIFDMFKANMAALQKNNSIIQ